jgi:hypothetical protein
MASSNRFGGRGTAAGPRVQVGSAREAETGTIIPAKQQPRGGGQGQLFSHDVPDVDVRGPRQQRVKVGIVRSLGIRGEHRGGDLDVHFGADVGQAPPALALHLPVDAPPPQVLTVAGGLQLPGNRDGANQVQIQTFKCGIVWPKLPNGPHRASLKVPEVNSQHSPLN